MVLSSLYLPMWGSSEVRLREDDTRPVEEALSPPYKTKNKITLYVFEKPKYDDQKKTKSGALTHQLLKM